MTTFVTAAFCLLRDGQVLTVRKAGSVRFQLPGGKIDPGENAEQAAVREVLEEVGVDVSGAAARLLGRFVEVAANEPGAMVDATIFVTPLPPGAAPRPLAEIAEQRWLDVAGELPDDLAPLLALHVLPALRALESSTA
ncbi:NUDIX hydrolase [Intrasporangium oryzae NRRL B-24470]|uniref:NUDIX hydrolase n=1 Tax=Intrasporangium oryzae NRRL B-24470 TaxID=1386089 RepID=W9G560_9MICO|nr:NUDIX domain-containing protein [Intrasporangium oryzae]EWT00447.1 NUDIX hydrolase [Intrasporangium oryzae NRRL B-24470]